MKYAHYKGKIIVGNYGYQVESTKTSYIKEILQHEFGERIGFQDRPQVNLSDLLQALISKLQ